MDWQFVLLVGPGAVVAERAGAWQHRWVVGKRVGQHDAAERLVAAGPFPVALLDLDCCEVVSEQHDLVGVDFLHAAAGHQRVVGVDELAGEVLVGDERLIVAVALRQQAVDERASPGERIQDVHALRREAAAEFLAQYGVDRAQHEVHELDGCVDDPQAGDLRGHGLLEERLVHLKHDFQAGV